MNKIKHPIFVKLVDIFEGEKSYYLIMTYLKGDSLNSYVKKNTININQFKEIAYVLMI